MVFAYDGKKKQAKVSFVVPTESGRAISSRKCFVFTTLD